MKVKRDNLVRGLPPEFEAEVTSIYPLENTNLMLVTLDYSGYAELSIPMSKEEVANLLLEKGVVSTNPGEEIPKYTSSKRTGKVKVGPKVGTIKTTQGNRKKLVKYDFTTPRLKGKRRVTCPDTGRKGFPIWEKL